MRGECTFGIIDEPWAAINSDCFTEVRNEAGEFDLVSQTGISGFDLGHPHDEYHSFTWNSWSLNAPVSEELYCQSFGLLDLASPPLNFVQAGHYSDPDENDVIPGAYSCKFSPAPVDKFDVYWLPMCWGSVSTVYSLAAVFESGGISYRAEGEPTWVCWAVAVIGGE